MALLSKRSYRDLGVEQCEQLGRISNTLHEYADNEWKRALEAICELLDRLNDSESDAGLALKKLEGLPSRQRDRIVRHLDLVLTAGMKEHLWDETRQAAEGGRIRGNRIHSVWACFQHDPIEPRVRHPP
ncbi:hypothetical protein FHR84_000917 [Actinopolyspora biskrensis]|uniref:Uncharacterized protein n=1 Tax=Actinopolyspora biskrensis TaxID=1470178 RepID=A0A852Z5W6_9ACTN|nr:hypothetical protein [Actinopolyspora biskrensis]NYH77603.1 hypothetical protein [Actinopolyspora biskrensis]